MKEQTRQQMGLAEEQRNKIKKIVEKSDLLMEMLQSYEVRKKEDEMKLTQQKPVKKAVH